LRPVKCKLLDYEFKLTDDKPVMGYSRAVPFAVRPVIREQIHQMVEDDDLEVSDSPHINPITLLQRVGKKRRLCTDMHHVNSVMIPDHYTTIQTWRQWR
jgi:hypothetical protein